MTRALLGSAERRRTAQSLFLPISGRGAYSSGQCDLSAVSGAADPRIVNFVRRECSLRLGARERRECAAASLPSEV